MIKNWYIGVLNNINIENYKTILKNTNYETNLILNESASPSSTQTPSSSPIASPSSTQTPRRSSSPSNNNVTWICTNDHSCKKTINTREDKILSFWNGPDDINLCEKRCRKFKNNLKHLSVKPKKTITSPSSIFSKKSGCCYDPDNTHNCKTDYCTFVMNHIPKEVCQGGIYNIKYGTWCDDLKILDDTPGI